MTQKVALGDECKDIVTGYKGICISIATHITGCDTVGIKSQDIKDGKPIECQWFDITSVKVLKKSAVQAIKAEPKKKVGGPQENPSL